jgi:hypothetical protein
MRWHLNREKVGTLPHNPLEIDEFQVTFLLIFNLLKIKELKNTRKNSCKYL